MSEACVKTLSAPLKWTSDSLVAFETLKQELQTASPENTKPFYLYVAKKHEKYATALLMQEK